ncbi:SusC/RagA family TonB-linked outer membrane protein [Gelidibacter japonicus]|uniref:SusC/RagA family TonB-linked outer membrane protein n=1 Tax=Gelidibacter japonicus TaxID=1962232 RepID=UPI0020211B59|nr:SusC/RagA family TonB-linked outer membrane protein [Gelidibacter japonicus]MCL8008307.1 SusC/RagA family TonB-linked outer membrane protein [Gelidibacter japonicus]
MIKNHNTTRLRRIFGCNLLLLIFTLPLTAQHLLVTGKVTDGNLPISGANVLIKNTNSGVVTDFDGRFTITARPSDTLQISYLGYTTLTIPINNRSTINVTLQEDATALGEVQINAGYYSTTDREKTGSIARITAKDIELQPVNNPLEALQGRMAGVEITQRSGILGAAPQIYIRGQNSLRRSFNDNGNLPLYIVDGMPINSSPLFSQNAFLTNGTDPLNTLNISNIESIEVLKDADATAIYGSRGANGVILITTKKKQAGDKTQVEASVYSGISRVSHFVDLLNTQQYLKLRQQAFENDGVVPSQFNAFDLLIWDQDRYTNWQKEFFGRTALMSNINLSVSGGNENTSYLVGASSHKQGSVFPGDFSYRKKTFNFSLGHRSHNKKFKLNLTANYGIDDNDLFSNATFVSRAFTLPPNAPAIYNNDGSLNWENSTWNNPFAALKNNSRSTVKNLIANLGLEYVLMHGLTLKTNMGYTDLNSEDVILTPIETYDPALWHRVSNTSRHSLIGRKSWIFEPQLSYSKKFGNHRLDALVGATFQENNSNSLRIIGTGYSDKQLIGNLSSADAVVINHDIEMYYKYSAVFARIGYNWKSTYFLNLTGRRDGSSRFGPGKQFANFGAIGAAWIFSNDDFVQKISPFLSFGKLRGSYGITGSDQIGDYRYLDTYQATPGPGGLYPTQLTNPDFSWETNKKLEAALELGFLKDKISLNIGWFNNRSSNQLVGYPLPAMTGFNFVEANLPATVQNTGWEFDLHTVNLQANSLMWKSSFNLTIPQNKLVRFPNIEETSYRNTYRVGYPLNLGIHYNFQGVDPETGLYTIEDVNGDGVYDFNDQIIIKKLGRQYYGGIQNQINYRSFSINFLLEFVKQDGYKFGAVPPGRLGNNLPNQVNLYQHENSSSTQIASQSIFALIAYNNAYNSDFAITDASHIRMKTLSLGYNIPDKLIRSTGLQQFKIFLHAQNLFTLTNYIGLDPQLGTGEKNLPPLQSFTAGVQLNF